MKIYPNPCMGKRNKSRQCVYLWVHVCAERGQVVKNHHGFLRIQLSECWTRSHTSILQRQTARKQGEKNHRSHRFSFLHMFKIHICKDVSESSLNGVEVAVLLVDQLRVVVAKVER